MARGSSNVVAVIVDDLRAPAASAIARGVIEAANRRGLLVTMTGGDTHPGGLLAMIRDVRSTRPRTLIVAASVLHDLSIRDELVRELTSFEANGGRVAIIGSRGLPFPTFSFAEREGASALARELADAGYRRPLLVGADVGLADLTSRLEGLREGFHAAGLRSTQIGSAYVSPDRDGGLDLIRRRGALELIQFDLIACVDDSIAAGVYAGLRELHFEVGPDIAVSGFGDYPNATALRPRLTTVSIPHDVSARDAVDTDDRSDGPTALLRIRIRESTPPRTVDSIQSVGVGRSVIDVAKRARASVATVTRVLNDPSSANSALRAVVVDAAENVGFSPQPALFSSTPTRRISIVLPGFGSHMHQDFVEGFRKAAAEAGYSAAVIDSLESSAAEADLIRDARAASDGVVLCAPRMPVAELESLLPLIHPAVLVDRNIDTAAAQIGVNYAEAAQTLAEHLVSLGHQRIAYLSGPAWSTTQIERERGLRAFERTHPTVDIVRIEIGASVDDGYASWRTLSTTGATAAIAFNDQVAIGLLGRLNEEGVGVPEEISVVGLDDIPFARFTSPPLTTMSVPLSEVGASAWSALRSLLEGAPARAPHLFEPRLVNRKSTGLAPAAR